MAILSSLILMKTMVTMNPLTMAISIMILSITTSLLLFKTTLSSWLTFVLILTFSSGMMTLFIYASSLAPNEKSKNSKTKKWALLMIIMMLAPNPNPSNMSESMKMFSNQMSLIVMTLILITTMVAIAMHGYTPYQPMTSNF